MIMTQPDLLARLRELASQVSGPGITPEKIALSVALGITLGVTPVLGSTSILCFLAAVVFRLNAPAIQLVNYFVYPLQFALLIPFIGIVRGRWDSRRTLLIS